MAKRILDSKGNPLEREDRPSLLTRLHLKSKSGLLAIAAFLAIIAGIAANVDRIAQTINSFRDGEVELAQFSINADDSFFVADRDSLSGTLYVGPSDEWWSATSLLGSEQSYLAKGVPANEVLYTIREERIEIELVDFFIENDDEDEVLPDDYETRRAEAEAKVDAEIGNILALLRGNPLEREVSILSKLAPVFDVSFFNGSRKEIILRNLLVKIYEADYRMGSSMESQEAHVLPVVHRYHIPITPIEAFEQLPRFLEDSRIVMKVPPSDYDLIPPVVIPKGKSARIQLQLTSSNGELAHYKFDMTFSFANGQPVRTDKVYVEF